MVRSTDLENRCQLCAFMTQSRDKGRSQCTYLFIKCKVRGQYDRRTLITIINSRVFSKLLYCSSVCVNTTEKNIKLLQTVQSFAAQIVSGRRKFDHVTANAVRDATMVFKCLNGLAPPYLCQKFKPHQKCTTATLGIETAYIYHSVGRLQVSARLPSEAKSCGLVSQTSLSLSLISMYLK